MVDETIYIFSNQSRSVSSNSHNSIITFSFDMDSASASADEDNEDDDLLDGIDTIDVVLVPLVNLTGINSPCAVYDESNDYIWLMGGLQSSSIYTDDYINNSSLSDGQYNFLNVFDVTSGVFLQDFIDRNNTINNDIIEDNLYLNDGNCFYYSSKTELMYIGGYKYDEFEMELDLNSNSDIVYSKNILIYEIDRNKWKINNNVLNSSHTLGGITEMVDKGHSLLYLIGGIIDETDFNTSIMEEYNITSHQVNFYETVEFGNSKNSSSLMTHVSAIAINKEFAINRGYFLDPHDIILSLLFVIGTPTREFDFDFDFEFGVMTTRNSSINNAYLYSRIIEYEYKLSESWFWLTIILWPIFLGMFGMLYGGISAPDLLYCCKAVGCMSRDNLWPVYMNRHRFYIFFCFEFVYVLLYLISSILAPSSIYVSEDDLFWITFYCYFIFVKYVADVIYLTIFFVMDCKTRQIAVKENVSTLNVDGVEQTPQALTWRQCLIIIIVFIFSGGFQNTVEVYSRIVHYPVNYFKIRKCYLPIQICYC